MERTWEAIDTTRNGKYGIFEHGPGGGVVATVHTSISPAAGHDNARLIAAAPELLAMLKEVTFCLEHSALTKGTYTNRTLKLAHKAIAKAEGE